MPRIIDGDNFKRPSPWEDGWNGWTFSGMHFGFRSIEQARAWFDPTEDDYVYKMMWPCGVGLAVYDVDAKAVQFMNSQLVFDPARATRLSWTLVFNPEETLHEAQTGVETRVA